MSKLRDYFPPFPSHSQNNMSRSVPGRPEGGLLFRLQRAYEEGAQGRADKDKGAEVARVEGLLGEEGGARGGSFNFEEA